jgi:predicted nucleic acid-binding protein
LDAAWALRDRFSAGDSLYAALAIRAGEPLLTSDMRLARAASDTGIDVRKP